MNSGLLRAYSQLYKGGKLLFKNPFRWFDVTVWPLILLFSLTLFVSFVGNDPRLVTLVVLGVMGWRAVYHAQFEVANNYQEEFWSNSLTHLFITPIRPIEMVAGAAVSGFLKFVIVFLMYYVLTFFLYGFVVPDIGIFLIAALALFVFGLSLGMITLGLLFLFQSEAFPLSFSMADVFVLISGAYYPVSVLPGPVQAVALLLPSTHAFNLLKSTVGMGSVDWVALLVLSVVWFGIGYAVTMWGFHQAKKTGKLVRVA
ncbi:MAG: ABC transporter permease [Candidatus Diapherotrites archaeon]|uniref:ABC transporter permease n=1 Tax=Candidatus Iainarchaeum sp. TaxID=3101447 RepID=A0A8T4L500_9ARCH|nr:ABC transporter permease [Candidatus Diapherotrites archaeon]